MQMIAARETGHAAAADRLPAGHGVADFDVERRQMPVERLHAEPVVDDDAVPVNAEPAGVDYRPRVRSDDRDAARDGEVEAQVDLLIDLLAGIRVSAMVGETGYYRQVAGLSEWTAQ